jgi:hypothetical protein
MSLSAANLAEWSSRAVAFSTELTELKVLECKKYVEHGVQVPLATIYAGRSIQVCFLPDRLSSLDVVKA